MPRAYLPRNDADLTQWLINLRSQLAVHGATVGLDAAAIKKIQEKSLQVISAIEADEKAYLAYREAAAHTAELKSGTLSSIMATIDHVSTAPGCTDAIRTALRIVSPQSQPVAANTYKVPLSTEAMPGRVVLRWKKGPLDGINVYGQRGSETEWRLLGRDNRPPFDDLRPLEKPGVPEQRRYRVIGVIDDAEVTPASDVVSVTVSD